MLIVHLFLKNPKIDPTITREIDVTTVDHDCHMNWYSSNKWASCYTTWNKWDKHKDWLSECKTLGRERHKSNYDCLQIIQMKRLWWSSE
jgi:hypothetical protein